MTIPPPPPTRCVSPLSCARLLRIPAAHSPSLSSEEVFQVDVVEAWQLQPPEEDEAVPAGTGSKGAQVSALTGSDKQAPRQAAAQP
jgi:hypothetical protein